MPKRISRMPLPLLIGTTCSHPGPSGFTQTISGTILDPIWKSTQYFRSLPTYIRDRNGNVLSLEYRAVEKTICIYQVGEAETPLLTQTFTVQEESRRSVQLQLDAGTLLPLVWAGSRQPFI